MWERGDEGRERTVGVSDFASLRAPPDVKRAPCKERPDRAHGSAPRFLLLPAASPHMQTNLSSSTATGGSEIREVCCLKALRKT